jgi:hypothetical protein
MYVCHTLIVNLQVRPEKGTSNAARRTIKISSGGRSVSAASSTTSSEARLPTHWSNLDTFRIIIKEQLCKLCLTFQQTS